MHKLETDMVVQAGGWLAMTSTYIVCVRVFLQAHVSEESDDEFFL